MKKVIFVLFFVGLLFLGQSLVLAEKEKDVPSVMYQFMETVLTMGPFLDDQKAFLEKSNEKQIQASLEKLSKQAKGLKHHKRLTTPGYQTSAKYFVDQLGKVNDAFASNHKSYAWRMFRGTINACSHCHTQEKDSTITRWSFSEDQLPQDPLAQANFLFLVRGYDQAWQQYDQVISTFGQKHRNEQHLKTSLDKLLTLSLRVYRSPQRMIKYLENLDAPKAFPSFINNQIQNWKKELATIDHQGATKALGQDLDSFEAFIDQYFRKAYPFPTLGHSQRVVMEYGSGLLFEWINTHPEKVTQRMNFWLGVANLSLGDDESVMMGEHYLKACIEHDPVGMISFHCFQALKDHWIIGFSGSSGIFLPKDIEESLQKYHKKLKIKQTQPIQ